MDFIMGLGEINTVISVIKIFFISIFSYYTSLKIINKKEYIKNNIFIILIIISFIAIICGEIKFLTNSLNCIVLMIIFLSLILCKTTKEDIGHTILITLISVSINYIVFFIAMAISFLPTILFNIQKEYQAFIPIILFYIIFMYEFFKINRFKHGLSFLQSKLKNEYFGILILNISIIVLFSFVRLYNYNEEITGTIIIQFIAFSIIMFITIQKSIQLYYKQKLLIQDLNETKEELEKKKQEVEELEKENLNFSKTSHSIAHKQKALEYKLNQLMMNSEISSEIDIKERIDEISKEAFKEAAVELSKMDIPEVDDMLEYMQSECVKNKINFQLQLNGNIHQMINNCVPKDKLEILLADHIKNAIIAVNHTDNENRSILVRLGMIDGNYSLYIYDSGIEFEKDTLEKLGKVPSTTHADEGGTGMGFMNTFDTLKKYKASMFINEFGKPSKEDFTKSICIKFDGKEKFEIRSSNLKNEKGE